MESCYPTLNWAYYTPEILVGGIWVMYGRIKKRSWSSREKNTKRRGEIRKDKNMHQSNYREQLSSYSPAHFYSSNNAQHYYVCLFLQAWLVIFHSRKTTKLVLIGTRHKQWWPFLWAHVHYNSKWTKLLLDFRVDHACIQKMMENSILCEIQMNKKVWRDE